MKATRPTSRSRTGPGASPAESKAAFPRLLGPEHTAVPLAEATWDVGGEPFTVAFWTPEAFAVLDPKPREWHRDGYFFLSLDPA